MEKFSVNNYYLPLIHIQEYHWKLLTVNKKRWTVVNVYSLTCDRKIKQHFVAAILPKLCRNCAFPQNFHIKKLGQITHFAHCLQLKSHPFPLKYNKNYLIKLAIYLSISYQESCQASYLIKNTFFFFHSVPPFL